MNETRKVRGRPRPQETIDRDAAVLAHLRANGPLTRGQIADVFGLPPVKVWLCLDRLRREGLVRTCARTGGPGLLWSAEVDSPCP
jgi:predicted ArsR family transcriptional regulator